MNVYKYVRAIDINNPSPKVYTAEEIADAVRGVGTWVQVGDKWVCTECGCGSRDPKRFCGYCGARNKG